MIRHACRFGLGLVSSIVCLLAFPDVSSADCQNPRFLYLGPSSQLIGGLSPYDPIDPAYPLGTVPLFLDSGPLKKAGSNPYTLIGAWTAETCSSLVGVFAAHPHVWLGLRNSDDQGTQFDLKAELFVDDVKVAEGEIHCVKGLTRNPALAKEILIPFAGSGPGGPGSDNECGQSDEINIPGSSRVTLQISARIGTGDEGQCSGHATASGLRLYYGAQSRPSRVTIARAICCTPGCDVCPPSDDRCLPPVRD